MADIAATLRLWSATAGNNQPTDSTTIGSGLDDNLRQIQAVTRQFLASYGTNIASAATMDLSTMDGYAASVTGNTTVTGLGTEAAGISYWLVPASTPMFKNSATLIMPGAADYTAVAGDILRFTSEGSGTWRCTGLLPKTYNGTGLFVRTDSPTLTGTPLAPTAAAGTSTTQIATTAFVQTVSAPTVQVFTTTGSNAWAKPANCKAIIVECLGAGGGGAGGGAGVAGGGGGAGSYTRKLILASSVAASVTATVGALGAGGGSGTNGATGGLSAFQGHCTASGGVAGLAAGSGGAGGTAVNGSVNISGGSGGPALVITAGVLTISGSGATSCFGGGAPGVVSAAGINAGGKGSGGGGASDGNTGGNGSDGIVIVTEFY